MQTTHNKQQITKKPMSSLVSISCYLLSGRRGYSLIELLVVIALIGLIGSITTQIFLVGLRAQAKSEILKEVKQNGDYAMNVMESMIRNAVNISDADCGNTPKTSITITNGDGLTTEFFCNASTRTIASISAYTSTSQSLTNEKVAVTACGFRIVCPTPATSPKYVFTSFTLTQANGNAQSDQRSTMTFEHTVSLRTY
jgi:prepilin-type N-terminal cleavage/methylation domain-containing protein